MDVVTMEILVVNRNLIPPDPLDDVTRNNRAKILRERVTATLGAMDAWRHFILYDLYFNSISEVSVPI